MREIRIGIQEATRWAAGSYYRTFGPLLKLRQSGANITFHQIGNAQQVSMSDLMSIDILLILRPSEGFQRDLIMTAAELGIPTWIDYDDDLLSIPPVNPASHFYNQQQRHAIINQSLRVADMITVSTGFLKSKYEKLSERDDIYILPNAVAEIPNRLINLPPKPKIYWRGSPTHAGDLETYREKFLNLEWSNKFELYIHGHYPAFFTRAKNVKFFAYMDIIPFFRFIKQMDYDFLIYPLEDNDFNRAKSNIAWLEATAAGAATISNFNGDEWNYEGIIDGANIALEKYSIPEMHEMKSTAWKESREIINEKFNLTKVNIERLTLINELAQKCGKTQLKLTYTPEPAKPKIKKSKEGFRRLVKK